jgi:hypothetical protein
MRTLFTLLVLGGLTACSSSAATGSPAATPGSAVVGDPPASSATPGSPTSAGTAPVLSADGKRFAKDTQYQGTCAPAGSRGGCYSFTFHPDGKAEHVLLDATDNGTYRIEGRMLIFRSGLPEAQEDRYESTDGFRTLGTEYHYVP